MSDLSTIGTGLFSVIVANYNNGKFLGALVESVRKQTYARWELVIVDDCSTDGSREILEDFRHDPRIKIIFHDANQGASAAFRMAASEAGGEIIGMLGADDALVPEAIQTMVSEHVKHPEASLICSNLYKCDEGLNIISVAEYYAQPKERGSMIYGVTVGNFATFKAKHYRETSGFDPFFKKALDHDIFLKLEEQGSVIYIPKPLYLYRANPIGISQNSNWFEATIFSLLGRKNAYQRRMGNPGIINLSRAEYVQLLKTLHNRKAHLARSRKRFLEFTMHKMRSVVAGI